MANDANLINMVFHHDAGQKSMKNTAMESLISTLRKSIPNQSASEIEFLSAYYYRLSEQDYSAQQALDFRNIALTHRNLGKIRKPDEIIVRLENPVSTNGDEQGHTVIYVISHDRPFIINSLRMRLNNLKKTPLRTLHPVLAVSRNNNNIATRYRRYGTPLDTDIKADQIHVEGYAHFQIDYTPESEHDSIAEILRRTLINVDTVVIDWQMMKTQVLEKAERLKSIEKSLVFSEYAEYAEFFRWITEDHFLFLGYCEVEISTSDKIRKIKLDESSPLGTLHTACQDRIDLLENILPPIVFTENSPVVFTKTRGRADIHRDSYMDCILFNQDFDNKSSKQKVSCFLGFLAGSTSVLPTSEIPHIRRKASYVLETSTLRKNGHAYKELRTILETLPRDMLFHIELEELYSLGMELLNQERRETRLYIHKNICGHFYSCLAYVPRDLFDTRLRKNIQAHLTKRLHAKEVETDVYFSRSVLARIHYVLNIDPQHDTLPKQSDDQPVDYQVLEKEIQQLARDWNEKLYENLKLRFDHARATACLDSYRDGFSNTYQQDFPIDQAISDILTLDHIPATGIQATLGRMTRRSADIDNNKQASFKLYSRQSYIILSDILPILEHMGVRIHSGRPYRIEKTSGEQFRILDFDISRLDGTEFDLGENAKHFERTFIQCWTGGIENDGFNRLTLLAGLDWRQISMIRAYYRYLKQIRLRYSENYIIETLTNNPQLAIAVTQLFETKFNPDNTDSRTEKLETAIKGLLEKVSTLDQERIIRALLDVVAATQRTNYFQPRKNGDPKSYISFKLGSRSIPRIPEPIPEYEIFIYSPRVEGVHLRGGKVARGGLRWSERPEDFRTEVLGLVKAQRVKNAVIVPVGSKGGFVARHLPKSGREEILQEVISCYKIFISSLLDITDNLSGTKIIPPHNVVRLDGDDPYLVVAADKGTATFSDIANQISEEYGFWLGDAFASGGSAGYDHKKMGITARGAWESVKRHFRELGKDIQSSPFTVVGIGDMAGDVFGNGMLLSTQIRLIAAFNHKHIFIDPDPDPASSYKARKRLFELPQSSWADYDQKLISAGGGIFSRSEKSITLSPQAKKVLDTESDAHAPDDLINLILKSEVELLWNGGIGTYVKSSSESHNDAQDRHNDSLRVDASELRCSVIGEGGNLGMTQLGRIEFCRRGGLCYTDAIDNSAGVDTSDHEVNIKILLNGEMQKGNLTLKRRNTLLAKMEDMVADLVLSNNYLQTQILSLETSCSADLMPRQSRAIQMLEDKGLLNRTIEFLPDDITLRERFEAGDYLTRPELAVLMSYSKMDLYQALLDSGLPDITYLENEIVQYFPPLISKTHDRHIQQHRLKREIISTQITNNLIGTMGATFHLRLIELTGASADSIAACYIAARDITDTQQLRLKIQGLDNKVDADVQMQCLNHTTRALESTIVWLLRNTATPTHIDSLVNQFKDGFNSLVDNVHVIINNNDGRYQRRLQNLAEKGFPENLAHEISARVALENGLDIVHIALQSQRPVDFTGKIYFGMVNTLGLSWLQNQISTLKVDNIWHERSKFSLSADLRTHQSDIASSISNQSTIKDADQALAEWQESNQGAIRKLEQMTEDLKKENDIDISMLSVLVSELNQFK